MAIQFSKWGALIGKVPWFPGRMEQMGWCVSELGFLEVAIDALHWSSLSTVEQRVPDSCGLGSRGLQFYCELASFKLCSGNLRAFKVTSAHSKTVNTARGFLLIPV